MGPPRPSRIDSQHHARSDAKRAQQRARATWSGAVMAAVVFALVSVEWAVVRAVGAQKLHDTAVPPARGARHLMHAPAVASALDKGRQRGGLRLASGGAARAMQQRAAEDDGAAGPRRDGKHGATSAREAL